MVAPGTRLWVNPDSSARRAADTLTGQAREDELRLTAVPGATWFTGGTPSEVRTAVSGVVSRARAAGAVPVLVAYNLPGRDAVDLLDLAKTSVHLDGTHSARLSVGDAADRLVRAGVQRADGVFLDVSAFETTDRQVRFGRWVSQCVDLMARAGLAPTACPSQYSPADPADVSTWSRTDDWFTALYATAGLRPTTTTGDPLVDAYLWVKVPGESDGQCVRGSAGPVDPARGVVDPVAGAWFPDLARELVANADPAL